MAKFRIINNPEKEYIDQAWIFNDEYFTVDTAERGLVDLWYKKNAANMIYALQDDEVVGFFNIIPLTEECGKLFNKNDIKEEEIVPDHILLPEAMPYAQYLYVAAIAVKNKPSVISSQCVAALVAGFCERICTIYSRDHLKKIFVNPTTFEGNRFISKLGLEANHALRSIRAGNNIYALNLTPDKFNTICEIEKRYRRYVDHYEWQ